MNLEAALAGARTVRVVVDRTGTEQAISIARSVCRWGVTTTVVHDGGPLGYLTVARFDP
jgi:hypothetical protein